MLIYATIVTVTSCAGKRSCFRCWRLLTIHGAIRLTVLVQCIAQFGAVIVIPKITPKTRFIVLHFRHQAMRVKSPEGRFGRISVKEKKLNRGETLASALHFKQEDYVLSHSPAFLASLGFRSKINYLLKEGAVPTENKPLGDCSSCPSMKKPRSAGRLSQIKVIFSEQFHQSVLNMFE